MSESLNSVALQIKGATHSIRPREERTSDVKLQLVFAFNGVGKTRLSNHFKSLLPTENNEESDADWMFNKKILYYNAFTEDLFYWNNDLENYQEPKLIIQPNKFTEWILNESGKDQHIVDVFHRYSNSKLNPKFNPDYSEITFSYERGDDTSTENIKISKGEESNFIWSIFYSVFEQIVDILNTPEPEDRDDNRFDSLEYIFIDDPVTSLDDNHIIKLAVDLAKLIKSSESNLKFVVTTHNPLFYNVLYNEFKDNKYKKYLLEKDESDEFKLTDLSTDSPFAYHLFLLKEIKNNLEEGGELKKYHFSFLRHVLEKTSTFLGYKHWGKLLPDGTDGNENPMIKRILNLSSHSKHSDAETRLLTTEEKSIIRNVVNNTLKDKYNFNI